METIGSKRSYALTWCMPNNDDDDDDDDDDGPLLCLSYDVHITQLLLPLY